MTAVQDIKDMFCRQLSVGSHFLPFAQFLGRKIARMRVVVILMNRGSHSGSVYDRNPAGQRAKKKPVVPEAPTQCKGGNPAPPRVTPEHEVIHGL